MKTYFLLWFFLIKIYNIATCQSVLLVRNNIGSLYILNLEDKKRIVVSDSIPEHLVGYNLNKDTLICFFESNGKLESKKILQLFFYSTNEL